MPFKAIGNLFSSAVSAAESLVPGEEIIGDVLPAAAGSSWLLPAIMGGASYLGQTGANKTNMQIAQNQMDFQREMSDTAYQRATKDMMAAGLNPMLAYTKGGASTPGGATTQVQSSTAKAVDATQAQMLQNEQIANIKAQTTLSNAAAAKTMAETAVTTQELSNRKNQDLNLLEERQRIINAAKREGASAKQLEQLERNLRQAYTQAEQDYFLRQPLARFNEANPRLAQIIQGLGQFFGPTVSSATRLAK
jgi:hypothetical protein